MPRGRPRRIKEPHHIHLIMDRPIYDILVGPMREDYQRERKTLITGNDLLRSILTDAASAWQRHEPKRAAAVAQQRSRLRILARAAAEATDEQLERAVGKLIKFTNNVQ